MTLIAWGLIALAAICVAALVRVLLRQQTLNHRITTQLLGAAMTADPASRAWAANKILAAATTSPPAAAAPTPTPQQPDNDATGVVYDETD